MSVDLGLQSGSKYVWPVLSDMWLYTDKVAVACAVDIFYTLCARAIAN